jgi:hypothetical protein
MQKQTANKMGCGCGGGGAGGGCNCGGGCACGKGSGCGCKPARLPAAAPAACSPCDSPAFVRPRFFAGQLLTEDDLSSLMDYVLAKQRFQNARLFGAGVVCGLEVQCGPCDSSQVVVQPGYALDCCGNDLVLTCARTLDVAAMIRNLQAIKKDSGDCSDPCGPTQKDPAQGKRDEKEQTARCKPRYALYARYAERPDQPVAAYPVGDDCDSVSCEPTRVVEGVTFELRCPVERKRPPFTEARAECLKQLQEMQLDLAALAAARVVGYAKMPQLKAQALMEIDVGYIERNLNERSAAEQLMGRAQLLATVAAPLKALKTDRSLLEKESEELQNLGDYAERVAESILKTKAEDAPTELDRLFALKWASTWNDKSHAKAMAEAPAASAAPTWNAGFAQASIHLIDESVRKLKQVAGCFASSRSDCKLAEAVEKLSSRGISPDGDKPDAAVETLAGLPELLTRWTDECRCAAINPPCPPCDDPGVLLAELEVDGCKVTRICNTVRDYVKAPSTLRYWGALDVSTRGCCGKSRSIYLPEASVTLAETPAPAAPAAPAPAAEAAAAAGSAMNEADLASRVATLMDEHASVYDKLGMGAPTAMDTKLAISKLERDLAELKRAMVQPVKTQSQGRNK